MEVSDKVRGIFLTVSNSLSEYRGLGVSKKTLDKPSLSSGVSSPSAAHLLVLGRSLFPYQFILIFSVFFLFFELGCIIFFIILVGCYLVRGNIIV